MTSNGKQNAFPFHTKKMAGSEESLMSSLGQIKKKERLDISLNPSAHSRQ